MSMERIGDGASSGSPLRGKASLYGSNSNSNSSSSSPFRSDQTPGTPFTPLEAVDVVRNNKNESNGNTKKTTISSVPNMAYETPTRRNRGTPSKFVFLSDRKSVPTELKHLQERTIKRRRDFLARMHDLDCHTAKLMSQYAEERMDLDLATCDTFERTIIHPLISSVERLAIYREGSSNRFIEIPALERRIGRLDAQMTRHVNVTMGDAKINMLDSLHDDIERNLKSEIRMENNKFNKIEGGIVQRFETVAGSITRSIHAEGAARRSGIELLRDKIEKSIPRRVERAEITLSKIEDLRAQLHEERAKRQASDKAIYEEIVRRTTAMKRAMIAMASDGDSARS